MDSAPEKLENSDHSSSENQRARMGIVVIRVLAIFIEVILFVVVISWLALIITNRWLIDFAIVWPWLMIGSGGVALVALLNLSNSLAQDLWNVVSAAIEANEASYKKNATKLAKENWVSLFSLVVGIVLFEAGNDLADQTQVEKISSVVLEKQAETTNLFWGLHVQHKEEESSTTPPTVSNQPDYVAVFPVFYNRAKLRDGIPLSAHSINESDLIDGVQYDESLNNNLLRKIVDALMPCGTEDRPLRLSIEGYASSEPFFRLKKVNGVEIEDGQYKYSTEFNVRAANLRAANLTNYLRTELIQPDFLSRFDVKPESWSTITEMELARGLNDRPTGGGETNFPQDFLTRSAAIKITDPGRCEVSNA